MSNLKLAVVPQILSHQNNVLSLLNKKAKSTLTIDRANTALWESMLLLSVKKPKNRSHM